MNNRTCQFSKILGVVDGGSISKWVGKPLDQIDVDVNDDKSGNDDVVSHNLQKSSYITNSKL